MTITIPNRRFLVRLAVWTTICGLSIGAARYPIGQGHVDRETFGLVAHIYPYYVAVAWIVGFAFGGLVNRITHGAWEK